MNNYVATPLLVCEVIQEAQKKKKKDAKIKVLKDNESWALKDVLRGSYDMTVKWNVPDSKPPYTPNLGQSSPSNLLKLNCDKAYHLLKWKPNWNFEETVKNTITWYKKFYENKSKEDVLELTRSQIYAFQKSAIKKDIF